jgi:predicted PurR-regulated permease PerM
VLVVLAFLAAAWVGSALWAGLLLGLLMAFTIEPWNRYLLLRWPQRRSLAAAMSVTFAALICAGVLVGLSVILTHELVDAVSALRDVARNASPGSVLSPSAQRRLEAVGITPAMVAERFAHLADRATEIASAVVSVVLGSTFSVFGGILLAFFTAYYTLRDQYPIERRLERILPLNPQITRELVDDFRRVGRGTLIGSVIAGLIQGGFAAAGFALGGVPRALLLGVLTAAASFVPVFGTLLVWVPVGIGLILSGHFAAGVFEIAWGVLVTTTLVDYVIRPAVVGRESRLHPLLFLIGVIGGVEILGGVGVIAGPIVMAFFVSVLRIYRRDVVDGGNSVVQ